jgi:D-methionine transport system substrate-binding protein
MKKTLIAFLVATLVLWVGGASSQALAPVELKVGATPVPHSEILEVVKPILKEKGISLKVIEFTDYVTPNLALNDGDIDANYFQHIPYLEEFASARRLDITYMARVHIEPMGAYSKKVKDLEDLTNRAKVGIPNDPTNGGRALLLLERAGVIELDDEAGITATIKITKGIDLPILTTTPKTWLTPGFSRIPFRSVVTRITPIGNPNTTASAQETPTM